jgi:putative FmdB family regulatory protein
MPFYDYRCQDCDHTFEELLPIARRDEAVCPRCGSHHVKRLVAVVHSISRGGDGGGASCAPTGG